MYIYQLKEWPHFIWDQKKISEILIQLRHKQGQLLGGMESIGFHDQDTTVLKVLTQEVVKSSEIERESLDLSLVRSSVARQLGMEDAALNKVDRTIEGVVQMMLDAIQNFKQQLTDERLFFW